MLADLLARTNEVMLRTMAGTGELAPSISNGKKKKGSAHESRRKTEKEEDEELMGELQQDTLPVRNKETKR